MKQDNHLNPNGKRRWGYSGTEASIEIGKQTVGETGGVDHLRNDRGDSAASNSDDATAPKSTDKKAAGDRRGE